jgi:hypothetical protein
LYGGASPLSTLRGRAVGASPSGLKLPWDGPEAPCAVQTDAYKVGVRTMGYSPKQVCYLAAHKLIPETLSKEWAKEAKYDPIERAKKLVNDAEMYGNMTIVVLGCAAFASLIFIREYSSGHTAIVPMIVSLISFPPAVFFASMYLRVLYRRDGYEKDACEFGHDLGQLGKILNRSLGELLTDQCGIRIAVRTILERLGTAFREAREGFESDPTNTELEWEAAENKTKFSDAYDLCLRFGLIEKPKLAWKPYLKRVEVSSGFDGVLL